MLDFYEYLGAAISIHAAREGGDSAFASITLSLTRFQSTPPVKAATMSHNQSLLLVNISIHAAREGGDVVYLLILVSVKISIHAAREGGDAVAVTLPAEISYFNPRRP